MIAAAPAHPSGEAGLVSIVLVNWNGGAYLPRCLRALQQQRYQPLELLVVDNASSDGSLEAAEQTWPGLHVVRHTDNVGFCRGFNRGVGQARGEYVLSLNADIWPTSDFLERLVEGLRREPAAGLASAKLYRGTGPQDGAVLDSTGLFLNSQRRPHDRGQGERDAGRFDGRREVFGSTGAACLYRREFLNDVACRGEILDEDFFVYYDDADLSWRAQLLGWRCLYQPMAVAWHARGGGDTLRRRLRAPRLSFAQIHAIKNRYLMIWKNDSWSSLLPALPLILAADLTRVGYIALRQPVLLRAYAEAWRLRRRALEKRREIQARRRVDEAAMRRWLR